MYNFTIASTKPTHLLYTHCILLHSDAPILWTSEVVGLMAGNAAPVFARGNILEERGKR